MLDLIDVPCRGKHSHLFPSAFSAFLSLCLVWAAPAIDRSSRSGSIDPPLRPKFALSRDTERERLVCGGEEEQCNTPEGGKGEIALIKDSLL